MTATPTETEVKVRVHSAKYAGALLTNKGFAIRTPRHFEANLILDSPENHLRSQGEILRPATVDRHKSRVEVEVGVESLPAALFIFERLGYRARFRYEKYRTEYTRLGDPGVVVLDETPIGDYIEIEGPASWIDSTARKLGFTENDYLTASYGRLYLEHCAAHGTDPTHMVFAPAV
jgi:adenylate cyclase class 2